MLAEPAPNTPTSCETTCAGDAGALNVHVAEPAPSKLAISVSPSSVPPGPYVRPVRSTVPVTLAGFAYVSVVRSTVPSTCAADRSGTVILPWKSCETTPFTELYDHENATLATPGTPASMMRATAKPSSRGPLASIAATVTSGPWPVCVTLDTVPGVDAEHGTRRQRFLPRRLTRFASSGA